MHEREAEARGIDASFVLEGNLFARSTWLKFTLSALDARGMFTPAEARRVNDQGLNLRLRVRNLRANTRHENANVHLSTDSLATTHSFAAQARKKRSCSFSESSTSEPSEGSKRRAREKLVQSAIIQDAMSNTALFE